MKRTVLQVIPHLNVGGVQRVVSDLSSELVQRGWNCFALSLSSVESSPIAKELLDRGVRVKSLELANHTSAAAILALHRIIRETKADVVHLHGHTLRIGAPLSLVRRVVAFVYTIHGELSWTRYRVDNAAQAILLRMPIYVAAVSEAASRAALRTVGIRAKRVIKNGVVPPPPDAAPSARTNRVRDGRFTFAMVSRLAPRKGHDVLMQSLKIVVSQNKRCRVVLIGDGPRRHELAQLVKDLELNDYVEFAGETSNVYSALDGIDALVHPSFTEGSPLCCIEAMMAGLPVIASAAGGLPELITNGATGYIVPIGDSAAVAEKMLTLSNNPALARKLGSSAREYALRYHTAEAMTSEYEEVYLSSLARRNRG